MGCCTTNAKIKHNNLICSELIMAMPFKVNYASDSFFYNMYIKSLFQMKK